MAAVARGGVRVVISATGRRQAASRVEEMIDDLGDQIQANAERLAPTDTTALSRSIEVEREGSGFDRVNRIGVSPDFSYAGRTPSEYAEYVENGTSISPAQPFMRPALYQARAV